MTNGTNMFVVDNKEATVEAIKTLKTIMQSTLKLVKQIKEQKDNKDDQKETCQNAIKNLFMLIQTIDKKQQTILTKDLDYLYKHCLFAVVRVRDNNDYEFLDGCVDVLAEITEGWERVGMAVQKSPSFG
tara:strand:+ start:145 stop:531 length:387 start_codon:yes stop_codon:yes gene_type:complete